ncbi:MAG: hypothetical protein WBQ17_06155 [Rhizomicrobium sp.]
MSGRFATITADLLARKGAAMPSAVVAKPLLDWTAPVQHWAPPVRLAAAEPHGSNHQHLHRDEAHYLRKIQIGLSDHDHERLRILSARKEASRQQIVRDALAAYFKKQAHAYGDECRCLRAGEACLNACGSR